MISFVRSVTISSCRARVKRSMNEKITINNTPSYDKGSRAYPGKRQRRILGQFHPEHPSVSPYPYSDLIPLRYGFVRKLWVIDRQPLPAYYAAANSKLIFPNIWSRSWF